jgi:hypothetical protein
MGLQSTGSFLHSWVSRSKESVEHKSPEVKKIFSFGHSCDKPNTCNTYRHRSTAMDQDNQ